MFGRTRHHDRHEAGGTAVADRDDETRAQRIAYEEGYADGHDPAAAQDVRRERFGGLNPGAAFFGWLVAIAVSLLLTGIVGAIAAAAGTSTQVQQTADQAATRHHRPGGGGRAAGRADDRLLRRRLRRGPDVPLQRLQAGPRCVDHRRRGDVAMVVLGAIFGNQYDIQSRVNLPRLPVTADALTTGGVVAALAVLVGTLVAAMAGGSVGTHYHRRVDRVGFRNS